MRFLVVGGSGLIGAHVVNLLRERGHEATAVARTARPGVGHVLDAGSASTDELRSLLAGHDGVVYAARTDERPVPKPAYPRDTVLAGSMAGPPGRVNRRLWSPPARRREPSRTAARQTGKPPTFVLIRHPLGDEDAGRSHMRVGTGAR